MVTPRENFGERSADEVFFSVTTENAAGRKDLLTIAIILSVVSFVLVAGGICLAFAPPRAGDDMWVRHTFAVLSFLIGPLLYSLIRFMPRGTWSFDAKGVKFASINNSVTFFSWDEIDAVNWGRSLFGFRRGPQKIAFTLNSMSRDERKTAVEFLEQQLKGAFDLRLMPSTTKIPAKRWLLMFAIAIPVAAIIMGWVLAYVFFLQPRFVPLGVAREVGLVGCCLPVLIPLLMCYRKMRHMPVWRERHQRYAIFDESTK